MESIVITRYRWDGPYSTTCPSRFHDEAILRASCEKGAAVCRERPVQATNEATNCKGAVEGHLSSPHYDCFHSASCDLSIIRLSIAFRRINT